MEIEIGGIRYIKRNSSWFRYVPPETKPEVLVPVDAERAALLDVVMEFRNAQ